MTTIRNARMATMIRVLPWRATSRSPSRRLLRSAASGRLGSSTSATGSPAEGSRTTSIAARRDAIVAAPKTVVGVATARMAEATNGPTSMPAPSIVPDRPFAAVSSSGVRDRLGTSEPCAGRVTDSAVAAHVAARTTTRGGAPSAIPTHVAP